MKRTDGKPRETNAADFEKHQRAIDQAKNERIKSEPASEGRESEQMNRKENRSTKTDVSHKKTGGGKQSSPGT